MNAKIAWFSFAVISIVFSSHQLSAQVPPSNLATPTNSTTSQPAPRKPCTSPQHRQFDFWIGEWEVTGAKGQVAGTNSIKPVMGGCVLHESWKASSGFSGESFNTYDASRNVWHQTWVDTGGNLLVIEGRYENDAMTLSDIGLVGKKDTNAINEIQWTKLAVGAVRQVWRTSVDGGKTWTIAFDGTYVKSARTQSSTAQVIADPIKAIYNLGGKIESVSDGVTSRVTKIDLNRTNINDADLSVLAAFPDLVELDVRQTAITDVGLVNLRGLTKLRSLNLFRNNVTNAGLVNLRGLTAMETLLVGGTKVNDAGLENFAAMTNLKKISVFQTEVSDAGLVHLHGMKSLRTLLYAGSKVTESGAASLQKVIPSVRFNE